MVIRQGHIPQNFYLILSGTAVVTKVAVNEQTGELYAKTVAFLKKGKYFGVRQYFLACLLLPSVASVYSGTLHTSRVSSKAH